MLALATATTKRLLEEIEVSIPAEPSPSSRRGQQVGILRDKGLDKPADAVAHCGRMAKVDGYNVCRHETVRERLFAHVRHCCPNCDRWVAGKMFEAHKDDCLPPKYSLIRITCYADESTELSAESIRSFEKRFTELIRSHMKKKVGWGVHASGHHDGAKLFIRAVLAVPPGSHIGSIPGLEVENLGSASAYKPLLAWILSPALNIGQGVLRGRVMAAFHGGNHFRSLGILYAMKSKKKKATPNSSPPIGVGSQESSSEPLIEESRGLRSGPGNAERNVVENPEIERSIGDSCLLGCAGPNGTELPRLIESDLGVSVPGEPPGQINSTEDNVNNRPFSTGASHPPCRDHREFCPTCLREGRLSERSYTRLAVYNDVKDLPHHLEPGDPELPELKRRLKSLTQEKSPMLESTL